MPNFTGVSASAALDERVASRSTARPPRAAARSALAVSKLIDDVVNDVVFDHLTVVRDVAFADAVEDCAPHLQRIQPQRARDVIDDALDDHHALRPAEAAERRVRHRVRLAAMRSHIDVFEEVGVVDVTQRAIVDRAGQIRRIAAARGQHELQREDSSVVVEADFVVGEKIMALAGDEHVGVAIEAQLDRPLRLVREHRRRGGNQRGLAFLAAEAAAHATTLHGDVVRATCRAHARRCAALPSDAASSCGSACAPSSCGMRDRDLTFEIEMILSADDHRAAAGGCGAAARVSLRLAAHDVLSWAAHSSCAASAARMSRIAGSASYSTRARAAARRAAA